MNIWKSIAGIIDVRVISADIPTAIKTLMNHGIQCFDVRENDALSVEFSIVAYDYPLLTKVLNENIATVQVLQKRGICWKILRLLRRPVLVLGIILLTALTLWLPTRVLFVSVEGNREIPANQILDEVHGCGIYFGADRRSVRSERVKNYLLDAIPDLQWVGVNTYGCVTVVSVRERTPHEEDYILEANVGSIIARCDGVIKQLTVYSGNPVCKVGQAVVKGQTLVSAYTDCGIIIKATRANAEIVAETQREQEMVSMFPTIIRGVKTGGKSCYSAFFGKKLIKLYKDSGILDAECVRIQKEYHVLLPGGFVLPFGLIEDRYEFYKTIPIAENDIVDYDQMRQLAEEYLKGQMVAGIIISAEDNFQLRKDSCILTSKYICQEMIGKLRREENFYKDGTSN